mmetsp:Transcript_36873/g.97951  ORF Transcript_36873/g.97951 Transcript_36873/m.97951 type:complete len:324 (+) Transcript_36873:464-1435(+)
MELAGLSLVMSMILLGLMNPTDLSLVSKEPDGAYSLPQDTSIVIGSTIVMLAFISWAFFALRAEIAEAQLTLRLIPVRWIRALVMFFVKVLMVTTALIWSGLRSLFGSRLPETKTVVGWRNAWETDKFSIRRRIYELERQLEEEARYDTKSSLLLFLERERRRALELSYEMLQQLHSQAFEELYDNQTRLEGLGQDVPAEMEIIKSLEERVKEVKERNAILNTRLQVEHRKAERARRAAAAAAGEEEVSLPGTAIDDPEAAEAEVYGANRAAAQEGSGEDGVEVEGPGVAFAQERRALRQEIVALEDRLQELELMLLDDDDIL